MKQSDRNRTAGETKKQEHVKGRLRPSNAAYIEISGT